MSKNIDAFLERADALLAELPPPLRVRLPELTRDGKRVVRELSVRSLGDDIHASYAERSGDVSARFKVKEQCVVPGIFAALAWAEGCGHETRD